MSPVDPCDALPINIDEGVFPVPFNTFITFGTSVCNCVQKVDSLIFRLIPTPSSNNINVFYVCNLGEMDSCQDGSQNITVEMSSGDASNFSIQFANPLPVEYNGSQFEFRVSGPRSGGSGSRTYELFFTVYVHEPCKSVYFALYFIFTGLYNYVTAPTTATTGGPTTALSTAFSTGASDENLSRGKCSLICCIAYI